MTNVDQSGLHGIFLEPDECKGEVQVVQERLCRWWNVAVRPEVQSQGLHRMDGAPILSIEIGRIKRTRRSSKTRVGTFWEVFYQRWGLSLWAAHCRTPTRVAHTGRLTSDHVWSLNLMVCDRGAAERPHPQSAFADICRAGAQLWRSIRRGAVFDLSAPAPPLRCRPTKNWNCSSAR
ncbi:MAG: hypothetical protein Udaeo2_21460 [Candidatus Udaeobacter sp.]|nr:MAG: hypothetical protein Udaeo2_21460 [Candidatus Udaeobacter sp.]